MISETLLFHAPYVLMNSEILFFRNPQGTQIEKCLILGTPSYDGLLDFTKGKINLFTDAKVSVTYRCV